MKRYEVIVGNIGTVINTKDRKMAVDTYHEYIQASKSGYGRAGNEEVTILENGEPLRGYSPAFGEGRA